MTINSSPVNGPLKGHPDFDYIGAEKSSVLSFEDYSIQFFWHQNLLEECESFSYKWRGAIDGHLQLIDDCIKRAQSNANTVAGVFESCLQAPELPHIIGFLFKAAYDEYFNYDVVSFESNLICRCFGVTKDALIADLQLGQTTRLEDWKSKFMVAMGCGTCEAMARDFFQSELDCPKTPSPELTELRKSKVLDEKFLIKPRGLTPIEFREFLQENFPADMIQSNIQVKKVSGYMVTLDKEALIGDIQLDDLKKYFQDNFQLDLFFTFS